jgi:hypothetical protein
MEVDPKAISGREFLDRIHDPSWFAPEAEKLIFTRFYSIVRLTKEEVVPRNDVQSFIHAGVPFRLAVARPQKHEYKTHVPWMLTDDNGTNHVVVERFQRTLPQSFFAVITTPLRGGVGDWERAARSMDQFAALVRAHIGANFLFQQAQQAVVELATAKMTTPSEIVQLPQPFNGPFYKRAGFDALEQCLAAIAAQPKEASDRISLALELFERGFQATGGLKFFHYWVAIEVLCDTHRTARILAKLSHAYGAERGYVQNVLGFDSLKALRTELFHAGKPHDMPSDVERYVQAIFIDLLRNELNLACLRLAEGELKQGFDLNRLKIEVGRNRVETIRTG